MIYYSIQHHGESLKNLVWLIKHLAPHSSHLEVALDSPNEVIVQAQNRLKHVDNVSLAKSTPVTWAGPSVVSQMREALHSSLNYEKWEYFINLSGTCVPILRPDRIFSAIKAKVRASKKTNFCYAFKPNKPDYWLSYIPSDEWKHVKFNRVNAYLDLAASEAFQLGKLDPVRNIMQRRGVYCAERPDLSNKSLLLRGLYRSELSDRMLFWTINPHVVGRQWVVLHRKTVEWICSSILASDIYNMLSQTFLPDESYFQTCLASAPKNIFNNTDFSGCFRNRLGAAIKLDMDELARAESKGALFARKIGDMEDGLRDLIETSLWIKP